MYMPVCMYVCIHVQENELIAMQEAVGTGGRRAKPKRPNRKMKPQAELDDEDLALIEIDKVRQKKERDAIKMRLRPEAQHPSQLKAGTNISEYFRF